MRTCKICYKEKQDKEFRQYKHIVYNREYINFDSYCKDCRRMYDKEQRRISRARKKDLVLN